MDRPEPGYRAPEGFHFEATPRDERWRVDASRRCRWSLSSPRRGCGKPSVLAINRGLLTRYGTVASWWGYCAEHTYGNWIENGQVMSWRLVADEVTP